MWQVKKYGEIPKLNIYMIIQIGLNLLEVISIKYLA